MENLALQLALQQVLEQAQEPVNYPVRYIETCHDCWDQRQLSVEMIHEVESIPSELAPQRQRFHSLIAALQQLPPLGASITHTVAAVNDRYYGNTTPLESGSWLGDVSTHFQLSSSFAEKGRILSAIVRYMRSSNGIELGSAYGMSAIFILETMKSLALNDQGYSNYHLATLEGGDRQYELSSKLLSSRYGDQVTSYFGWTRDKLSQMVQELSAIDFLFHDAGHSREDYLRDVHTILPIMSAGSIAVVDDIRWNDPRFYDGDPRTHEGWLELAHHPRVLAAIEVNGNIGIMLLGSAD